MTAHPSLWQRRLLWVLLFTIFLGAGVYMARHRLLMSVGEFIVASDPEAGADIIVLSVDAGGAEVLEAADMVRRGVAPRVAIFLSPPDPVALEFARRGLPFNDRAQVTEQTLKALGVARTERIETIVDGSNTEVAVLPSWCRTHSIKRVAFVVTADHSRRVRRMLGRVLAGTDVEVRVRISRFAAFHADSWWRSREGMRMALVEFEKLAVEYATHPLGP